MAKFDHNSAAIADSYAKAFLELTEEAGTSDDVLREFGEFVALMESDAVFGDFMTNPSVDADDRRDVLEKHFRGRMNTVLLNGIQIINDKGRCEIIPVIYERYRLGLEEIRNEVEVHVTSAVELTDDARKRIEDTLSRATGKKARLIEIIDPAVLGGLVVRIGDEKIDASVARRLEQVRHLLRERASHEIHSGREYFESANA